MFRFFRQLRQSLIAENRVTKYLLYAIGEIVLVVIGILIALQINNWNEERAERKQEQAILRQLKIEYTRNLEQLEEKIRLKRGLVRSVRRLLDYIDQPELSRKDSVDYLLGYTTPYSTFDPIENDLASSGSLRLIRSDSLKLLLSLWTSNIKDLQEDEQVWKDYRNTLYIPFLTEHYQLRNIRDAADRTGVIKNSLISTPQGTVEDLDKPVGTSVHKADVDVLLRNPDFEDHLERAFSVNRFNITQSLIVRERILEILALINEETSSVN